MRLDKVRDFEQGQRFVSHRALADECSGTVIAGGTGPAAMATGKPTAMLVHLDLRARPLASTLARTGETGRQGKDEHLSAMMPPAAMALVHVLVNKRFASRSAPRESRLPCA